MVGTVLFVFAGIGINSLLGMASVVVLVIGSALLWRPGSAPILLFIFGFQWLQISLKIFHANALGQRVDDLADYGGDITLAISISLIALLLFAVGIRLGVGGKSVREAELSRMIAQTHGARTWFRLYIAAWIVASLAQSFTWVIPGLSQPLIALAGLKWAFYWMLAYATFVSPGANRQYWALAFSVEFLLSLGGFFAEFKTVLFFTLFAVAAAGVRLSAGRTVAFAGLAALTLVLCIVWTAIKPDFRKFASGGEASQLVVADFGSRLSKSLELAQNLDGEAMATATESLLRRIAYVDFFARVLDTVPLVVPHEEGALWLDAISRPFMPRLLFADKEAIDDSVRTNYYTRLAVAGASQGTSISIGYMGESYIDFGHFGMMAPIFGLGLFLGWFHRWIMSQPYGRGPLGMGLASATLFHAAALESSITKVFGTLVVTMLVAALVVRFAAPRYFSWVAAVGRR